MESKDKIKKAEAAAAQAKAKAARSVQRLQEVRQKAKQEQARRFFAAFEREGMSEMGEDELAGLAKKAATTPPEDRARLAEFGKLLLAEQRERKKAGKGAA